MQIDVSHLPDSPGIYRVLNTITGECYVGGSSSLKKRGTTHAVCLHYQNHVVKPMQESYDAHGSEGFRIEVLDQCDRDQLLIKEAEWIDSLNPQWNSVRIRATKRCTEDMGKRPTKKIRVDTSTMPVEKTYEYSSVKIRDRDYDAAKEVTKRMPLALIDVLTAWRILWESVTEKEQMGAILQVRQQNESSNSTA